MLGNIQALRALAALMVVVVHVYAVEATYLPGRPWTSPFHICGSYGVDLFFVISGTVMVFSTAGWFGERGAVRRFLIHRAVRIYPPYWLVTVLVLVAYHVVPAAVGVHRSARPDLFASFLALPQAGEPLLVVGWTLSYEILFYLVFAAALRFPLRRLWLVAGVWLAAVVAVNLLVPAADPWARVIGSPLNLEFALGMLIGGAALRGRFVAPRVLFVVALCAIVAVCVAAADSGREFLPVTWWRPAAVGLPMALLVYAALGLEREGLMAPRALRAQGDASYALYLWHVPVIGAIGFALHRFAWHGTPARIAIVAGGYALAIAVSFVAYRGIERPLLRLTHRYRASVSTTTGRKAVAQTS